MIDLFTLGAAGGMTARIMTLGGIVTHLHVPDSRGDLDDVVLGFDDLAGYLAPHPYFGAIIGRVAGRLTGARFDLDGVTYRLAANDGNHHIHGGVRAFDKCVWSARVLSGDSPDERRGASLRLSRTSPGGEEGYPGNVDVWVTYTVTDDNRLVIDTRAVTDAATPLSMTHHSYFNLAGTRSDTIEDHHLQVHADRLVPTDERYALSGRAEAVEGRGCDLRSSRRLRDVLPAIYGRHGDLYQLLRPPAGLIDAARVVEPGSGRVMTVSTTERYVQFYSGAMLDGTITGKGGRVYRRHAGFCLECEGYPDGMSAPALGSIVLRPGETYQHTTVYAFSTV